MLYLNLVLLIAAAAHAVPIDSPKSYTGYKTFRVFAENSQQLSVLRNLSQSEHVDFWSQPRSLNAPIDIMVSPQLQGMFLQHVESHNIPVTCIIEDVQKTIDQESSTVNRSPFNPKAISFNQYYRYDEIVDYITQLAADYPNLATVETIGTTYEGRDIKAIKISSGGNGTRPALYLEAGIHAREWIAPAVALYLIYQLVERNAQNSGLTAKADWFITPVTNPDGYEYTHTNDRFWRKNRNAVSPLCKGTDANRNFGFHWGGEGASTNPCSETYRGASAFSEKESAAHRDYAKANNANDRIKLYIALHSYGPYFLYPWGYQWDLPDDWKDLDTLARNAAAAIEAVDGTEYEIGSSTQLLYAAAGGSDDYMKGGENVKYAYTVELPGGGSQGFNPPASSIQPIVTETWEGLKVVGNFISNL